MSETLHDIILYLSLLSSFSALAFSLFTGKGQTFIVSLRFFLLLSLSSDLVLIILARNGIHNLFVMPIYMMAATIIVLIWMYRSQFDSARTKSILFLLASLLILTQLVLVYLFGLNSAVDIPYALLCITSTIVCVYYYYFIAYNSPKKGIRQIPFFWINTGFLFYFGLTIIINMVFDYILTVDMETFLLLWSIQIIATIVLNSFIITGLWKTIRKSY